MKKLLLCLVMLFVVCGCSGNKAKYNVGVIQLVKHDALDKATQGFVDELNSEFGKDIAIEILDAAGDPNTCGFMATNLVAEEVNLIMANATPAVIACRNITNEIPIVGTSVTDYGSALQIDNFDGITGNNVTGTSDLAPLDVQAKMILELLPNTKTVGILYCLNEANSLYQVNEIEKTLKELNVNFVEIKFSDSNDLATVLNENIDKVDALYVPTDNTCASNGNLIAPIAKDVPIIAGEKECCKSVGGLATLSIDYYGLGQLTGVMAGKILRGEAKPEEMKIETYANPEKLINMEKAQQFNVVVPSEYKKMN